MVLPSPVGESVAANLIPVMPLPLSPAAGAFCIQTPLKLLLASSSFLPTKEDFSERVHGLTTKMSIIEPNMNHTTKYLS